MANGPPVTWGIVSTADINRKVIPAAQASEMVELVAVASRTQKRADTYAQKWGIPRAYGSYEALLADPEIDAVYISLPNTLHCEWSIRALDAGKHVLCEKPLSRQPEEVVAAFDAAERNGRLLSEAFMYRHNPQTARIVELVEGGALMDVGCYNVSASRLLAGEPERVWAEAWYGPTDTDWVVAATMRFPDDVLALFDCGTALVERDELEAIGSEGSLFVEETFHVDVLGIELRYDDGSVERIELDHEDSYRLELENVSAAIRGEAELLLGREDAVAQSRVLEALHRSATTGEPVTLEAVS